MKGLLSKRVRNVLIIAVLLSVALGVAANALNTNIPGLFVKTVLQPLRAGAQALTNQAEELYSYMFRYEALLAENEALKARIAQMEDDARTADALRRENERLKNLLKLKTGNQDFELVDAYIIGWDPTDWSSSFTMDKGSVHGVEEGMCVITENGEVIHTIFMMDTHNNGTWTDENGNTVEGYDHLWDNQIEWYKWAVNGIAAEEGRVVESSAIMHIPVYEFRTVWEEYYDDETDTFTGPYAADSFGVIHETPCPGAVNNHFMDVVLDLDSTKNMIFGHDHVCNASIVYEGVRLSYGLKLGQACYYEEGLQGGSTLSIASDGSATFAHYFCD